MDGASAKSVYIYLSDARPRLSYGTSLMDRMYDD